MTNDSQLWEPKKVTGTVAQILQEMDELEKYTDDMPIEDVVLIETHQTKLQEHLSKLPYLHPSEFFTIFVEDADNLSVGDTVQAEVKPVWRGFNVFESESCGYTEEIEVVASDG